MTKRYTLNRRSFLRGSVAGGLGVTVGLPVLECMLTNNGDAFAADGNAIPKRYTVCFAGTSLGSDRISILDRVVPSNTGRDYDTPSCLQPLRERAIRDQVSFVSNLEIPTAQNGSIGPGQRTIKFHGGNLGPLLTGTRAHDRLDVRGASSDQVLAGAMNYDTAYKSLTFRVQAASYVGGNSQTGGFGGTISIGYDNNRASAITPRVNPKSAFDAIFGNFAGPNTNPEEQAAKKFAQQQRKSILDFVADSYVALDKKLSGRDKLRLQKHLDEIRDLEKRIDIFEQEQQVCMVPEAPSSSWPVAGGQSADPAVRNSTYSTAKSYSNEIERSKVLTELLYLAHACDLTRISTLQYTFWQSFMSAQPLTGRRELDIHQCGHNSFDVDVELLLRWHIDQYAMLVQRLSQAEEGAGSMLDNSVVVFLTEGGHGRDPEIGRDLNTHSTENMIALVAGGANLGLDPGKHIRTNRAHPARVLLSGMQAAGYQGNSLGEVNGRIDDLFAAT